MIETTVPLGLRRWFVVHFVVDIVFAVPLLFIPEVLLPPFGWQVVDPVTSRLVGAALLGIGVESLLGRNAAPDVFRAMLNLKVVWASGAALGLTLSLFAGAPPATWIFLGIFGLFLGVWLYYRIRLR